MSSKILVIEDNAAVVDLVVYELEETGHQVKAATNGPDGIALARGWLPDLILLDVMMPGMDGYEVCHRLRDMPGTSTVPIIMLTAKSNIDDKEKGFQAGADDYIVKPFVSAELMMRISAHLRRARMTSSPQDRYVPASSISVPFVLARYRSGVFKRHYRMTKRLFDVVMSLIMLPFVLLLMALIALLVRLDSPGPIFFVQKRTGLNGRRFRMYKFRTMYKDAEALKEKYAHLNELSWPDFKITDDPRITRVGKILRRTSLDEIPQVLNILKGDMSFVGPRPTSFSADTYQLWQTERLEVRPGLTGLWQVKGRSDIDFGDRSELDIEYIERQSWQLDMQIIWETVTAVILGRGAY
jgi:lipopolysaccharide/colanic/teichoic acid biosynthesis glycosyltransferase/CheY-like chemotaxis protein